MRAAFPAATQDAEPLESVRGGFHPTVRLGEVMGEHLESSREGVGWLLLKKITVFSVFCTSVQ